MAISAESTEYEDTSEENIDIPESEYLNVVKEKHGGTFCLFTGILKDVPVEDTKVDVRLYEGALRVVPRERTKFTANHLASVIGGNTGLPVSRVPALRPAPPSAPKAANDNHRARFQVTWFADIEENQPKEHVIYGAFGVNEFSVVVGKPGTGKSVIVTDAACHVAAGLEWHGRKVKPGLVIYFAAERKALTERRMRAFRKRHNIGKIPLAVVGGKLDMTRDLSDAKALAALVKEAEWASGASCVWIILDTLSRTFGGGDQNASKDMGKFVQAADEIMRATGAHVTVIHHSPWNEDRGKGAIDLDGAVDTSFVVSKSGKTFTLRCDGTNDGEEGPITSFGLESVEVGTDIEGKPTTAPVVIPKALGNLAGVVDDVEPKPAGPSGVNGKALAVLKAAIAETGEEMEGDAFPAGVSAVTDDVWQDRFKAAAGSEVNPETVGRQYRRAVKSLLDHKHVTRVGQWIWPT